MIRVAILLPAYNSAAYLPETIAAIQAQTYSAYGVVAVDDASTDGTYDLLLEAQRTNPERWKVSRNPQNLGMTSNWNSCLDQQRRWFPNVDYLIKIDSDDIPDLGLIQQAVESLDANPTSALCHVRQQTIPSGDQQGVLHSVLMRHGWSLRQSHHMPSQEALRLLIRYDNFLASSGTMFRRSSLEALTHPRFDESYDWAADYELWTRLAAQGSLLYAADVSIKYRVHGQSVSGRTTTIQRRREIGRAATGAYRRSRRSLSSQARVGLVPWLLVKWWHAHAR